jgi:hypothetical protein
VTFDFLLQLLGNGGLGIHVSLMLIHHVIDVHVMSFDGICNNLLEGLPLVILLGLKFLEGSGILQHLSTVSISSLLKSYLLGLFHSSNFFLLLSLQLSNSIHQLIVSGSVMKSHC